MTRSIYHKRDETILGHVYCSLLALRLRRELGTWLGGVGKPWEWAEIIQGLDHLSEVTLAFQSKKFTLRSELAGQAGPDLRGAGVAALHHSPRTPGVNMTKV